VKTTRSFFCDTQRGSSSVHHRRLLRTASAAPGRAPLASKNRGQRMDGPWRLPLTIRKLGPTMRRQVFEVAIEDKGNAVAAVRHHRRADACAAVLAIERLPRCNGLSPGKIRRTCSTASSFGSWFSAAQAPDAAGRTSLVSRLEQLELRCVNLPVHTAGTDLEWNREH
jgi:hypothetical protein